MYKKNSIDNKVDMEDTGTNVPPYEKSWFEKDKNPAEIPGLFYNSLVRTKDL
jgi:hypothetical protein